MTKLINQLKSLVKMIDNFNQNYFNKLTKFINWYGKQLVTKYTD